MRYLLCAFMALALNGCASVNYAQKHADAGHYSYNPNDSMALNVARATGLTECDEDGCAPLRDVPREKLPASMQGKTNLELAGSVMDALTIGQGVGQIAGAMSVVTGVGSLAGGLLTLGSLFTGPVEMHHPATIAWVNAWMPKSMADSPSQAMAQMTALVTRTLPKNYNGYIAVNTTKDRDDFARIRFSGKRECNEPYYACSMDILSWSPTTVKAGPAWISNRPAYVWQNWKPGQKSNGTFHGIKIDFYRSDIATEKFVPMPNDLDMHAYLAEFSANLPDWVYIYVPPTERHSYPVVINQGKLLLFVEPKTAVASTM